ncbi:MAG: peptidase MA family metallohydrolase [Endomicrobiales bacterium]
MSIARRENTGFDTRIESSGEDMASRGAHTAAAFLKDPTRRGRRKKTGQRTALALLLAVFFAGSPLGAALRNSVITRDFKWQISRIKHFDVYYYDSAGKNLLPHVEDYLQSGYRRSTRVLPVSDKHSFPILIYNTHNEFEQTNVTPIGEGTGGVTEAFKNRLLVGNLGSQRYLEYVLAHEFTHEIEYVYLFGGFWRSAQLLRFVFYPGWLMEGLAEYTSGDLDYVTREMYLRDAALDDGLLPLDYLFSFNHVMPHRVTLAYKESEALMHHIAREYGEEKLSVILSTYRTRVYADAVLINVLGLDQSSLDKKFRESLKDSYAYASRGLQEPEAYGKPLTRPGPYPAFNRAPAFSPDGEKIAFLSDRQGTQELYLLELATGKKTLLWNMARHVKIEQIHDDGHAVSFSPDGGTLAFIGESGQQDLLCLYRLPSRRLETVSLGMDSLASPAYAKQGDVIYLSGIKDGFRDLYAYSPAGRRLTRLTAGPMDEIDAAPSPDGTSLYFAGERENEAGRIEYDLCRLDLASGTTEYVTALPGDERSPSFSPDGAALYFTSDQSGVTDIYRRDRESGRTERLTAVKGGNFTPRPSPDGKALLFSSFRHTQMHLYLMELAGRSQAEGGAQAVVFSTAPAVRPVPTGQPEYKGPYRFRLSTDLVYPFIAYSSLDGLYFLLYWQLSEFMGNHQISAAASYAGGEEYLDYTVSYGYLRFRPQFFFNFTGLEYFRDMAMTVKRKESAQTLLTAYPLNRFQEIDLGIGTVSRQETVKDQPLLNAQERENVALLSFMQDTTYGPYLETTRGSRFMVSTQLSDRVLSGTYKYQNYSAEEQIFFPLGKENVLFWRLFGGASVGDNPGRFALGGPAAVRGLPVDSDLFGGNRVLVNTLEWRFPLVYDINYHIWFFFPDFFFKTLYGTLFVDTGVAWDNDTPLSAITIDRWKGSYGVSLRFHTFILESAYFLVSLELARRMDDPSAYSFYLSPGYSFGIIFPFGSPPRGNRSRDALRGYRLPSLWPARAREPRSP